MPKFFYRAKNNPNNFVEGLIESQTKEEAINKLNKEGYFTLFIKETSFRNPIFSSKKITSRQRNIFYRQLNNLIGSGINLLDALNSISKQLNNAFFLSILKDIISNIKNGKSFSESLVSYEDIFGKINIALIKSGEASGNLAKSLSYISNYLEKEETLETKLKEAFIYPIFILVVGFFSLFIIFSFVIPKLTLIFQDLNQALPMPTQILINISNFIRDYKFIILGLILSTFIFLKNIKNIPKAKLILDKFILRLAYCGNMLQKIEILRFTQVMYLLLSSGINIIKSLELACGVLDNKVMEEEFKKIKIQVIQGFSLSSALKEVRFLPDFTINLINVGEETGSLDESFSNISSIIEKELDHSLKMFIKLLEPSIILIMGLIVGFIVVSILLPIFQMNLIVR
ncbi:MAG: type II secretion system F family protein [Candidatus Omnitrophota bacterium]